MACNNCKGNMNKKELEQVADKTEKYIIRVVIIVLFFATYGFINILSKIIGLFL